MTNLTQFLPWKTAVVVAVDLMGGFSKAGKIPWHHPEDFKWFQQLTKNNICVMGRVTYDDINEKLGDMAATSVLPSRECYVVTSKPLPRMNATPIPSIVSLARYRDEENAHKTVFFIGGEQIYKESVEIVDEAYVTVINDVIEGCDRFFPVQYVADHFKTVGVTNAKTFDAMFTMLRRVSY